MTDPGTLMALGGVSFLGGALDAIVGGGGLIVLPSLLIGLPNTPTATVLGTSKLTSVLGTATAAVNYIGHHRPQYRYAGPMAIIGLLGAALGAFTATRVPTSQLKPITLAALTIVWLITWRRKDFGATAAPHVPPRRALLVALAGGSCIGFYDGLVGPGTGFFLLFLLINAEGASFLRASSTSKLVNTATNTGALALFFASGHVKVALGLTLAACNICGSAVGSRLAIYKGSAFIRSMFLVVVAMLIARLAYDVL